MLLEGKVGEGKVGANALSVIGVSLTPENRSSYRATNCGKGLPSPARLPVFRRPRTGQVLAASGDRESLRREPQQLDNILLAFERPRVGTYKAMIDRHPTD
jgi:hypothetical protein